MECGITMPLSLPAEQARPPAGTKAASVCSYGAGDCRTHSIKEICAIGEICVYLPSAIPFAPPPHDRRVNPPHGRRVNPPHDRRASPPAGG